MKSMTGSRKAINILHRLGHCLSYTAIEEIETAAAYTATSEKLICPSGIIRSLNLDIGLAWDNFDSHNEDAVVSLQNTRKRRMFEPINVDFPRDAKKYKINCQLIPNDDRSRDQIPEDLSTFKELNIAWILSYALNVPNTPMWVYFNAKIIQDESRIQKIAYLTQINESPTDINVVKETMRRSLTLANECGKMYMQVTYDLAIAKIAYKIQSEEKEEFKQLFIHLSAFHIIMAYFKAVGKFINGCGITNMLVDTGILAQGSVNGFILGSHFNRCRKYHPLVSAAIQIMHFESFLQSKHIIEVDSKIKDYLMEFQETKSEHPKIENEMLKELLSDYQHFTEATLNREHGKTPQIYLMYVQLIDYYLHLERSIRQGYFELFRYILPKLTNLFIAFNQPNYARYLVLYHNNLLKVETTHPGLENELKRGSIGIKRTTKPFSRIPVDLTLEQTINADAARRTSGVINLTNSFSARQKWAVTHSLRAALSTHLLEVCDLKNDQDITNDLKNSIIKKRTNDIHKFIDNVKECTNPFSNMLHNDHLYNIASGQSIAEDVYNFLSRVEVVGEEQRQRFIADCNTDENNFKNRIRFNKILNFESASKKKVKISGKIQEIKIQRDIFGRLLYVSQQNKIDIDKTLCYPLTPIPFSLCHLDGNICKTPKSVLLKELEIHQSCPDLPDPYINVIDGFFSASNETSSHNIQKYFNKNFTRHNIHRKRNSPHFR
ncbi:uncharacterized protein [Temnothorax nylanderi]|uniref:uncharacterized protein isoform X1 n=1 Tax=Temnothorax nylanderi TaxID=102681 RepID=UPI003A8AE73D